MLTTNRVGNLDEAFKSRIHMSLYYPRLDKHQKIEIFKVNIRKLRDIVAEKQKLQVELEPDCTPNRPSLFISEGSILDYASWYFDSKGETPEQRWNGRQIRNAFQMVSSLAKFDMQAAAMGQEDETSTLGTPRPRVGNGQLDWRQFDMVAKAIEKFEDYLHSATNGTDGDRARKTFIREDEYDHRRMPQKPGYRPPSYSPAFSSGCRPGQNTASSTSAGQHRPHHRPQYQPPSDEQLALDRHLHPLQSQGRPEQRLPNAPDGRPPARRYPNTGDPPIGGSRSTNGFQDSHPGPMPARLQRSSQIPNINIRPVAKLGDSGYSGWSTAPLPPNHSAKGRQGDALDDDGLRYQGQGYHGGESYEEDYYQNGKEDHLDHANQDDLECEDQDRYSDNGDAELCGDYQDMEDGEV